jgi:hypothetical protein
MLRSRNIAPLGMGTGDIPSEHSESNGYGIKELRLWCYGVTVLVWEGGTNAAVPEHSTLGDGHEGHPSAVPVCYVGVIEGHKLHVPDKKSVLDDVGMV